MSKTVEVRVKDIVDMHEALNELRKTPEFRKLMTHPAAPKFAVAFDRIRGDSWLQGVRGV